MKGVFHRPLPPAIYHIPGLINSRAFLSFFLNLNDIKHISKFFSAYCLYERIKILRMRQGVMCLLKGYGRLNDQEEKAQIIIKEKVTYGVSSRRLSDSKSCFYRLTPVLPEKQEHSYEIGI